MSKDFHNNERYLRELADKYSPVPPPAVWDEIEQVLDKDKDKRRFFPLFWMLGILIVGATLFLMLSGKKDQKLSVLNQETIIRNDQKQRDTYPGSSSTVDSEAASELPSRQHVKTSKTIFSASDKPDEKILKSEKLKSVLTQQQQQQQQISNNSNVPAVEKVFKDFSNKNNSLKIYNVDEIATKENIIRPRIVIQAAESTSEERQTVPVMALQQLKSQEIPFETVFPQPDPGENLPVIFSAERRRSWLPAIPWFVELGGGVGRNLSSPVSLDAERGAFRLNTESRWYAWSAFVRLGYEFDNSWYTTIGLGLHQTKRKFEYWRRDVSSLSINENQMLQITKKDFFNTGEIRYTFADVGLSVGKRIELNNWRLSLEGGPIFNVLFNANGKVQVDVLEFSRLEDQEAYFNTRIGLGARLSAMLDFPVSDQMWLSVGPTYHQYFNTISSDGNPLEERNAVLQVRASVRYDF